jgi:hypothetical protein
MTVWSREQLLDLWERGSRRHTLDRALLLAASGQPGVSLEALADVPIGALRQALLALRRANYGRHLPAYVDCPACGTRLELALDGDALRSDLPPEWVDVNGRRVRPPTSRDVAIALAQPDLAAARSCLAARCLAGSAGDADGSLTPAAIDEMEAALSDFDGAADVELDLSCDACGHVWQVPFDIGAYLWQELDAQARRLLGDVHVLARTYGWTEGEVLALSDERRATYVAMATAAADAP